MQLERESSRSAFWQAASTWRYFQGRGHVRSILLAVKTAQLGGKDQGGGLQGGPKNATADPLNCTSEGWKEVWENGIDAEAGGK